jgi:hypothetical protein
MIRLAGVVVSDLRTRIIAAIRAADTTCPGRDCDPYVEIGDCCAEHLADAVIVELGLNREGPNQAWIDAELPIRYRYVTEWTTDD